MIVRDANAAATVAYAAIAVSAAIPPSRSWSASLAGTSDAPTRSSSAAPSPSVARALGKMPWEIARRLASAVLTASSARSQRRRVRGRAPTSQAQVEGGADQPLLRSVVQVAFDALTLGVGRGDDPPAGGLDVGEASPADCGQLDVPQREAGRRAEPFQ